jgi:hypothetical protein
MKTCIDVGVHPQKLNTLVKTRFNILNHFQVYLGCDLFLFFEFFFLICKNLIGACYKKSSYVIGGFTNQISHYLFL